ncbi:hypothetical protein [Wukongibacter sp. M2B1]|uniref:hypothetical protein n=1 Tax=Wukongibacter sp. M2B1 TaxID=3088895 RepID=UPI003D7AA350
MSKRCKFNAVEKLRILMEHEKEYSTVEEITYKYEITKYALSTWKYKCKKYGIARLEESKISKKYSKKLKETGKGISAVIDIMRECIIIGVNF